MALAKAGIEVDRKMMADLAVKEPQGFRSFGRKGQSSPHIGMF